MTGTMLVQTMVQGLDVRLHQAAEQIDNDFGGCADRRRRRWDRARARFGLGPAQALPLVD